MRRLSLKERVGFKRSRWLLLKNPWNLNPDQKERLSTLVRWNEPMVRAYYLKESFQLFWDYKPFRRAEAHLQKGMTSATRSRLAPFKRFVCMLRSHLNGVLPRTRIRLSKAAVEGINNKIKSISHHSFRFRTAKNFIAAIYHCCAQLKGNYTFGTGAELRCILFVCGKKANANSKSTNRKVSAGNGPVGSGRAALCRRSAGDLR